MNNSLSTYVLDSFALIAFFQDEPGPGTVADLLTQAQSQHVALAMTVANLAEVVYKTLRRYGPQRSDELIARIDEYAIEITEIDRELAMVAADIKANHRMSYADCLAAALAVRLQATMVTGDPEFRQVDRFIDVMGLPQQ